MYFRFSIWPTTIHELYTCQQSSLMHAENGACVVNCGFTLHLWDLFLSQRAEEPVGAYNNCFPVPCCFSVSQPWNHFCFSSIFDIEQLTLGLIGSSLCTVLASVALCHVVWMGFWDFWVTLLVMKIKTCLEFQHENKRRIWFYLWWHGNLLARQLILALFTLHVFKVSI